MCPGEEFKFSETQANVKLNVIRMIPEKENFHEFSLVIK